MKKYLKAASLLLAATLILSILFNACAIHPLAWKAPSDPGTAAATKGREVLTLADKIPLQGWYGPEDIVFDSAGNLYTGVHKGETSFKDGCIMKIDKQGRQEVFYQAGSWVAGLHFDVAGNLVALSHRQGLIRIGKNKKVEVLADKDESGQRFLIPNGLDIARDGKIYFSNTSEESAYTIRYGKKIILEMKPLGGLYCYDPATQKVTTLIKGTFFGNGVVLSQDESHLLMVETSQYRILRYWLKGPNAGKTEPFMENLPGFPNGISIREDGSYWLGFTTRRNADLDNIHSKPFLKKLLYGLPSFLQPSAEKFGMIMNISSEGAIINTYFDTKGMVMPEAGAVKEYQGNLYLGGDLLPHIGKLPIDSLSGQAASAAETVVPEEKLTDSQLAVLKGKYGVNKTIPAAYERPILVALSHFPELTHTDIRWEIRNNYTPLSTRPVLRTVFNRKSRRAYIITISRQTIDTLQPLLFDRLSFEQQVGIMGHELSHVLDFKEKSLLGSLKNLVGHLDPRFLDAMEYHTDLICIHHGLGNELKSYSRHVRQSMQVRNWRGVDYVYSSDSHPERYMNPETIEKYMNIASIN